jgi:hypothetical protein
MAPELVELLIDGARYGDAEDVHTAIEHKVNVNAQDEDGRTGAGGGPALAWQLVHSRGRVPCTKKDEVQVKKPC